MSQPVEVVVSDMHMAAARLQDAGQRLQDSLSGVDLEVREMLGSGWKGDAASAFGSAWEQWHGGAGQVIRAIQTMSELLTVAGKEYGKTDEHGARAIGSTMHGGGSVPAGSGSAPGTSSLGTGGAGSIGGAAGIGTTANAGAGAGVGAAAGISQQVASLAQQMMPQGTQLGQLAQPLAQAAQAAAGLVGVADQGPPSEEDLPETTDDEARTVEPAAAELPPDTTTGDAEPTTAPVELSGPPTAPDRQPDRGVERPRG